MNFTDKVALVTGGSSGIGKTISIALAKEGCQVIFTYNSNLSGAEDTLKTISPRGAKYKIDFQDESKIIPLFEYIKNKYGKLDILVNNAGVNSPRDMNNPNVWKEVFQINLFSPVLCIREAVKLMTNTGRILNVTSVYGDGKACDKGLPVYGASKAALNHYTQTLAKNLAPGVLVNAIAPGYVQTPLWKATTEAQFVEIGKEQLIERMIQSKEIAEMALAIIKNDAMTGEVVYVDGGLSLKTV